MKAVVFLISDTLGVLLLRSVQAQVDCAGNPSDPNCLQNPIVSKDIFEIIDSFIVGVTPILISLSVLAIVWAGFQFILAQGSETKITNAKKRLTNVVIGVALILGAAILVGLVTDIIASL